MDIFGKSFLYKLLDGKSKMKKTLTYLQVKFKYF